jgi:hypothetical protein
MFKYFAITLRTFDVAWGKLSNRSWQSFWALDKVVSSASHCSILVIADLASSWVFSINPGSSAIFLLSASISAGRLLSSASREAFLATFNHKKLVDWPMYLYGSQPEIVPRSWLVQHWLSSSQ